MNNQQRWNVLGDRRRKNSPHHAPPKVFQIQGHFIVNAACYEHRPNMLDIRRRYQLAEALSEIMRKIDALIHAWAILPNHYHFQVELPKPVDLRPMIGKVHGRLSRTWNLDENTTGRKVWYNSFERPIRSRRHFYTTLNYIHHNPVKHGYCDKWQDWETGSARNYLNEVGYQKALEIWKAYPIKSYGKSIER